ncbi:hypothetical protein ABZW47_18460 [Streptomyces sp. NPDC004549]|uniref:hypothetical protein n=1 Tax=Streptomyces sp. NPDC004549 TaxID=3154283 RepID=UPI0033A3A765
MADIDLHVLTDRYVTVWNEGELAPRDGGEVVGVGLEILMLGSDGRIVSDYPFDYQFIEG